MYENKDDEWVTATAVLFNKILQSSVLKSIQTLGFLLYMLMLRQKPPLFTPQKVWLMQLSGCIMQHKT